MAKVSPCPITGCWWWTAGHDAFGYGRFNGKPDRFAHRVSWILFRGPIPPGMCVLHRCDQPACVNPDHLFLGTLADNNKDTAAKGRTAKGPRHPSYTGGRKPYVRVGLAIGERHPCAKLTDTDVRAIRSKYTWKTYGFTRLAAEYGVRPYAIENIVRRRSWKHVV